MKRVLVFDGPKGPKRFELIHRAILSAGDGKGERNRETIRKEARILEALDGISDPKGPSCPRCGVEGAKGATCPTCELPIGPADPDARKLASTGQPDDWTILLEQDDFALLEKNVDKTPWMPRVAREVVDVQDWLSAAEKVDKEGATA